MDKDDKDEGLFKRLKNIENEEKVLINGNNKNKPDSAMSKLSIPSIFDSISISSKSKDEDENEDKTKHEKTARELYQDRIEGMKGLKLLGESKDQKSQLYLENNLNKTKNRFFKYIANEEKTILTMKYFHLKLMILIFMINMVHCTII